MSVAVETTFFADELVRLQAGKMQQAMTILATEYSNRVKSLMRDSPASGRTYRRGGVTHQASAPGEPPAPDTGALVRSILWQVRSEGGRWFAEVGTTLPYALYLEYGAARGVRGKGGRITAVQWILFPRPAWGPALEQFRPQIPGIFARLGGRK